MDDARNTKGRFRETVPAPPADVVPRVVTALRRRGFTRLAQVDLRAELGRRVGANIAPHVIVLALNPAITVRILRSDPAAADLALAVIVLRETDTGTAIEVPAPAEPADAMTARAVEALHSRLLDVIKEAVDRCPLIREPS